MAEGAAKTRDRSITLMPSSAFGEVMSVCPFVGASFLKGDKGDPSFYFEISLDTIWDKMMATLDKIIVVLGTILVC